MPMTVTIKQWGGDYAVVINGVVVPSLTGLTKAQALAWRDQISEQEEGKPHGLFPWEIAARKRRMTYIIVVDGEAIGGACSEECAQAVVEQRRGSGRVVYADIVIPFSEFTVCLGCDVA